MSDRDSVRARQRAQPSDATESLSYALPVKDTPLLAVS